MAALTLAPVLELADQGPLHALALQGLLGEEAGLAVCSRASLAL